MSENTELADYVKEILTRKGLSTYDVQRASGAGITAATVTKILNREIKTSSLKTLSALAKGLGEPETAIFRVARGLPAETSSDRMEILAEAFDGKGLSEADWIEIESVLKALIDSKKANQSERPIDSKSARDTR
jgi:transcriptional regulator with XRE-family HTH domain